MSTILPYVIIGLTTGSVYGLAATGLVLTYRTSGIFNFAHGAVAAAAAYFFYWLYIVLGLPWPIAFVLSVFIFGPLMGLVIERIARHITTQTTAMKIVGTIGIILIVQGLTYEHFGALGLSVPQFLPGASDLIRVLGVNISYSEIVIFAVSLVAVGTLYLFFRYTRQGITMQAVVDSPELLSLQGGNPDRVRLRAWIIGATFASLCGVLLAPTVSVDAISLTYLVVSSSEQLRSAASRAFPSLTSAAW